MEQNYCICGVMSLQGGESAQETAVFLAKMLCEKNKQSVLYAPAGIQFAGAGEISLTDLYFAYRKKQPLPLPAATRRMIAVSPFHCFLEAEEITDEAYFSFFAELAGKVACLVVSLDGLSPGRLHWFLEHSQMVVILVDCAKGAPIERFLGFLHNLKLLWGEDLYEQLKRFLFILSGGTQEEKAALQQELRQEIIWLEQEENILFITDEEMRRQKSAFWKKTKETWRKPI